MFYFRQSDYHIKRLRVPPIEPLCTATPPITCPATLTRPFPWCKFMVHTVLVKLKRRCKQRESKQGTWSKKGKISTHPNRLTSRRMTFHDIFPLTYLNICDGYSACARIELQIQGLPDSLASRSDNTWASNLVSSHFTGVRWHFGARGKAL